jgi:hypothetical protein
LLAYVVLDLLWLHGAAEALLDAGYYLWPAFTLQDVTSGRMTYNSVMITVPLHLVLAATLLIAASWRLRAEWGVSPSSRKRPSQRPASTPRESARTLPRGRAPIPDWVNPVFVKEAFHDLGLFGRTGVVIFAITLGVCISATAILMILALRKSADYDNALQGWFLLQMALLSVVLPAFSANAFTKEIERKNADALRMTLLRPSQVVSGKALASAIVAAILFAAVSLPVIPLYLKGWQAPREWLILAAGYASIFLILILSVPISLLASIMAHRMNTALVTAYMALSMLSLGNIYLVGVLTRPTAFTRDNEYMLTALLTPYFALHNLINAIAKHSWIRGAGDQQLTGWAYSMALYTALALATLCLCYVTYRWRQRRET